MHKGIKDLTGQRFGKLLVVKPTEKRSGNSVVWECQCDCGNVIEVRSNSLCTKHTQSCGCWNIESNQRNLIGQRFGRLVVINITDKRQRGRIFWGCLCDCGNYIEAVSANLINGGTKSCGCLRRELAKKRADIFFVKHGLSYTRDYKNNIQRIRTEKKVIQDSEWTFEMETALRKFQPACVICGATENLEIDHVLPLSKGFGLKPGNAVILCKSHNSGKRDRDLYELPLNVSIKLVVNAVLFEEYWINYV